MNCRKNQKKTFREILQASSSECMDQLQKRAYEANRMAKISRSSRSRSIAYQVKNDILNHGVLCGFFHTRSDEQGRGHLLRVGTDHGSVHMPIGKLQHKTRKLPGVQAVLGFGSRIAG